MKLEAVRLTLIRIVFTMVGLLTAQMSVCSKVIPKDLGSVLSHLRQDGIAQDVEGVPLRNSKD